MSRFPIAVLCGVLVAMAAVAQGATEALLDTRILIDVSGSMKITDPGNLRRPALRLLVGLLPPGSRAGIWLFSEQANMLVPLGKVDKAWKERARRAVERVHSRGLFTNIEDALQRATEDWRGPDPDQRRHVVLLTDGMVDVSKDSQESTDSRTRILDKQLPRLRDLGAKVHTVALSDQVDHALLRRLSETSGGWSEQAQSADALQRVFLHLFEQVGNPDTVPLKDNRFRVDQSIREVTLIVFRPAGAPATHLIAPNGTDLGPETPASNVSWHQDQGYDLLTLRAPMTGEWRVRAGADPDNRVLILTDLRMDVSPLPNRMVTGAGVAMEIGFENQGKPITRQELLDVLQVSARQVGPGEIKDTWPVRDDGQHDDSIAYDGKFQFHFRPSGSAGRAELVVTAEGKTFQREKRTAFELVAPAAVTLLPLPDAGRLRLRVQAVPELVDPASLAVAAELVVADASHTPVTLIRQPDGVFQADLDPNAIVGTPELWVQVRARTIGGESVAMQFPGLPVQGRLTAPPPQATPHGSPQQGTAAGGKDGPTGVPAWFGVANLLLVVVGGLGFWLWRRRTRQDPFQLVEPDDALPPGADASGTRAQE